MFLTAKEQVNVYTSYNEEDLLQLLHLGDEKAFTLIYNQYWDKLYFLAHKHLKSSAAAEEIVQDGSSLYGVNAVLYRSNRLRNTLRL